MDAVLEHERSAQRILVLSALSMFDLTIERQSVKDASKQRSMNSTLLDTTAVEEDKADFRHHQRSLGHC
eukprot:m.17655 g.17655  ORF g.17655 m.17655 type:complete len:69 (-) comp5208_c0_seq1:1274-1480(-)